jgi:hypothetical protein
MAKQSKVKILRERKKRRWGYKRKRGGELTREQQVKLEAKLRKLKDVRLERDELERSRFGDPLQRFHRDPFRDVNKRKTGLEQDILATMLPEFSEGNKTLRDFIGRDVVLRTQAGEARLKKLLELRPRSLQNLDDLEEKVEARGYNQPRALYDNANWEAPPQRSTSRIRTGGAKSLSKREREKEKRQVARELAALGIRSSSAPDVRPKEQSRRKRGTYEQRSAYEAVLMRTPEEQAAADAADAAALEKDRTKKRRRRPLNATEQWLQKQNWRTRWNPLLDTYESYEDSPEGAASRQATLDYIAAEKAKPRHRREARMRDLASVLAESEPREEYDDDETDDFIAPSDSDATEPENEEPDEEAAAIIAYNLRQKRRALKRKLAKRAAAIARIDAGLDPDVIPVFDSDEEERRAKKGSGRHAPIIRAWWW